MDKTAEINSRLLALEKQFPNDLNVAALKIYVDFCLKNHDTKIAVAEKHHILTRASFPAFAKEPTILVRLSPASHLKAHYLLVLALPSNLKALYAFNLMINTRGARAKTAGLYSDDEIQKFAAQYEATKLKLLPHLRQTGRIRGNSNAKSEWWLALGRREGRRAVESGRLKCMRTPENCAKGGRVSGRNHVESGTGIFGLSAEQTRINKLKGSLIGCRATNATTNGRKSNGGRATNLTTNGRKSAGGRRSKELGVGAFAYGVPAAAGRVSTHNKWHVNRGQFNPKCQVCIEEFIGESV
jgi:hypothetical protein